MDVLRDLTLKARVGRMKEYFKSAPTHGDIMMKSLNEFFSSEISDDKFTVVDLFCGAGGLSEGFRQAGAKKIPAFKVGGTWRFSRADIDNWIKQQSLEGLDAAREGVHAANGQTNDGVRK